MPEGPPSLPVPVSMDLSVPAEPRFVSLAAAMTRMVAEQAGYSKADAAQLAAEFERQVGAIVPSSAPLAVHYEASRAGLTVHVRAGTRTFELAPL